MNKKIDIIEVEGKPICKKSKEINMEKIKPEVQVIGNDGNVFSIMAICSKSLKREGLNNEAEEMINRVSSAESYGHALRIMGEYCELR